MDCLMNCESKVRLQNLVDECPEELLLKMFDYLDSASLKNLTLVNKRWHDIVTNDISTMKKLPLFIRGYMLRKNHLIVGKLRSKFYKIVFKSTNKCYNADMLSSLKTIGSNVRIIEFIDCFFNEKKIFHNILRNFPRVEKLMFEERLFRNRFQNSDTEVLKLEYLNELVLNLHNLTILCCIEAQLKSLKVSMIYFYLPEETTYEQMLRDFLYTQKRLETLEIMKIRTSSEVFAKKGNAEYQFKLKKLHLCSVSNIGIEVENLKDFLYTQKDSVEILHMEGRFSKKVHEFILNKFENLKTLNIDIRDLPADFERIKIKKNVTKLILDGWNEDIVQYCAFLSLFPNVTDISFSNEVPFEVLSSLPKYFNALTSLSLYCLGNRNCQNVMFPALKNLHLNWVDDGCKNQCSNFIKSNQTIESLSFANFNDERTFKADELKIVCEALPNLKHLILGGNMKKKLYHFHNMKKSIQISLT